MATEDLPFAEAIPPAPPAPAAAPVEDGKTILSDVLSPDRIPVVKPDGTLASVKRENYEKVIAKGARFQTPEEQAQFHDELKYGDRPLTAAAAGAGRGLTLGLSDVALRASGLVEPQTLRGIQKANPIASTLGEVGGVGASMLIPGLGEVTGPGLALKAGKAIEGLGAAAAERLGTTAALSVGRRLGTAAEGALYEAGNLASDSALGDPTLTSDKIIARLGMGAILGAATGGIGELASKGAGGVKRGFFKALKIDGDIADTIANHYAVKATKVQQNVIKDLGQGGVKRAAEVLRDEGVFSEKAFIQPKQIDELLQQKISAAEETRNFFMKQADEQGAKPLYYGMQEFLDKLPAQEGKPLRKILDGLQSDEAGYQQVYDFTKNVMEPHTRRNMQFTLMQDLAEELEPAGANALTEANRRYEALLNAKRMTESGMLAKDKFLPDLRESLMNVGELAAKAIIHPGAALTGIAALLHPTKAATFAGMYLAKRVFENYGSGLIANVADKLAKSEAMSTVAKSFGGWLEKDGERLGQYLPLLSHALTRGYRDAFATHLFLKETDPEYLRLATNAGLVPDSEQVAPTLEKAAQLSSLESTAKETDEIIHQHLNGLIQGKKIAPVPSKAHKTQDFGSKTMNRDMVDAHEQLLLDVQKLAANPEALNERVSKNLEGMHVAPAVGAAMAAKAQNAVKYLAQAGAIPPPGGPLSPKWVPSHDEMHAYAEKAEMVEDPLALLKHARAGTITESQVQVVQAVHPALFQHIREQALEKLVHAGGKGKQLPYHSLMALNLLTGIDPDGTLSPESIQANQLAIASGAAKQQAQQQKMGGGELSLAQRTMTESERSESRKK